MINRSVARKHWHACGLSALTLSMLGCGGTPGRVPAPEVSPEAVADALIEQYDTDRDGELSAAELKECPALATHSAAYDRNGDGSLRPAELRARLDELYADRVGLFRIYAHVTLRGRPLVGATIELIPEQAIADVVKPARGVTDSSGAAALGIDESEMPRDLRGLIRGVQTGIYRVKISHPTARLAEGVSDGTALGVEITQASGIQGLNFKL